MNIVDLVTPTKFISANEGFTKSSYNPKVMLGNKRSNFNIFKSKRNPILKPTVKILNYL